MHRLHLVGKRDVLHVLEDLGPIATRPGAAAIGGDDQEALVGPATLRVPVVRLVEHDLLESEYLYSEQAPAAWPSRELSALGAMMAVYRRCSPNRAKRTFGALLHRSSIGKGARALSAVNWAF